jgi:Ion channel
VATRAPPEPRSDGALGLDTGSASAPAYRYFAVLTLTLGGVVFLIAAPATGWSRAVALGIEGVALVVTIGTSRERQTVRKRRALAVGLGLLAFILLVAVGVVPRWLISVVAVVVTAGVPIALTRGLVRLLRDHGVTASAVAGSLAIYLSTGLVFAWIIGFIAQVGGTPYFSQHTSGTQGEKVYYSFTTLTTTGFGDLTPATAAGHALAVIEMLTGQLYLVTVIGLLIGNFAARQRTQ